MSTQNAPKKNKLAKDAEKLKLEVEGVGKKAKAEIESMVPQAEPEIEEVKGFIKKTIARINASGTNMRKEFVEFINRGSVIDLAVGVAVGGAFNSIVNSFVNDIVSPIVGLLVGGVNFSSLELHIPSLFNSNDGVTIAYGKFIQNVIQFLIVAWVFFVIVKMMNKINRKKDAENPLDEMVEAVASKDGVKLKKKTSDGKKS